MELVVLRVKLPDDEEPQVPDAKPDSGEHIVKELVALDGALTRATSLNFQICTRNSKSTTIRMATWCVHGLRVCPRPGCPTWVVSSTRSFWLRWTRGSTTSLLATSSPPSCLESSEMNVAPRPVLVERERRRHRPPLDYVPDLSLSVIALRAPAALPARSLPDSRSARARHLLVRAVRIATSLRLSQPALTSSPAAPTRASSPWSASPLVERR